LRDVVVFLILINSTDSKTTFRSHSQRKEDALTVRKKSNSLLRGEIGSTAIKELTLSIKNSSPQKNELETIQRQTETKTYYEEQATASSPSLSPTVTSPNSSQAQQQDDTEEGVPRYAKILISVTVIFMAFCVVVLTCECE
jgi:hypothetical protein